MINKLLIFLFSLLASLLMIEYILHIVNITITLQRGEWINKQFRIFDNQVCITKPEFKTIINTPKQKYEKLIIALGDSFTEGFPTNNNGYPEQLQSLINSKYGVKQNFKIVNFGLGDSGPDQQLRIFKEQILPSMKPDAVIWSFYPNDIWDNVIFAMYDISPTNTLDKLDCRFNYLYARNFIKNLPIPNTIKQQSLVFRLLLKSTETLINLRIPQQYRKKPEEWGYNKLVLEINEMERLSQQYNFEIYYVIIAPQSVYMTNLDDNLKTQNQNYTKMLNLIKKINNNSTIDINFNNENASIPNNFSDNKRDPNVLGAHHYNEFGYQHFAEIVFNYLSKTSKTLQLLKE
jgi:hypothetical protein